MCHSCLYLHFLILIFIYLLIVHDKKLKILSKSISNLHLQIFLWRKGQVRFLKAKPAFAEYYVIQQPLLMKFVIWCNENEEKIK